MQWLRPVQDRRQGCTGEVAARGIGRRLKFSVMAGVVAFFALSCGESNGPTLPQSSIPSSNLPPLFAVGDASNGPGRCLQADVDFANLTSGEGSLNCTSEDVDISIARVSKYSFDNITYFDLDPTDPTDRIECTAGQTVFVVTSAEIQNNAQERYDLGLWINPTANGSALTGPSPQCLHFNLVKGLPNVSDLDGEDNDPGDACGDVEAGVL